MASDVSGSPRSTTGGRTTAPRVAGPRRRVTVRSRVGLALCVLLAVFSLYTRPDFLVTLANQIWACF